MRKSIEDGTEYRTLIVGQYYETLLGRPGSASEIAGWVNQDLMLSEIEADFKQAPEYRSHQINAVYQEVLGRLATTNEMTAAQAILTDAFENPPADPAQTALEVGLAAIRARLVTRQEYRAKQIAEAWTSAFGNAPSDSTLNYWKSSTMGLREMTQLFSVLSEALPGVTETVQSQLTGVQRIACGSSSATNCTRNGSDAANSTTNWTRGWMQSGTGLYTYWQSDYSTTGPAYYRMDFGDPGATSWELSLDVQNHNIRNTKPPLAGTYFEIEAQICPLESCTQDSQWISAGTIQIPATESEQTGTYRFDTAAPITGQHLVRFKWKNDQADNTGDNNLQINLVKLSSLVYAREAEVNEIWSDSHPVITSAAEALTARYQAAGLGASPTAAQLAAYRAGLSEDE
ncbi:MAG TPA: hypothetical protein P5110_10425, partial [Candidatus Omnitrophota bacterium]|nr:hypothetical protein [Candidatus Omnitrophota bacterium]